MGKGKEIIMNCRADALKIYSVYSEIPNSDQKEES